MSSAGKEKLVGDEETLQAIILADSFNERFKPLTANKPRCLLPVCNASLLNWTFESLALAGVQEIFVVCRVYARLIQAAIKESKWSNQSSGLKIVPVVIGKETYSVGDALRDVYLRGIVSSDFVLVMGDLVSTVRIDEVVRVHRERRKANKDAIMTMVVKESGVRHRTRSRGDSSVFVLDKASSECLHYIPIIGYPPTTVVRIPSEIIENRSEVSIRNDLIDCSIDICSPEVLSLFQDNFDYADIRRDFVYGVLTSDLLMKNIYCYIVTEGYAARAADTKCYDSISKDILSRWTFPLVPDDNHPEGHLYEHLRGNKYIAKDDTVSLSRTCKIGDNCLIGSFTAIGDDTHIIASVIGRHCTIGDGSVIKGSYIFDGSSVGPGCDIERSIIGAGVTIKAASRIEKGCLIGDGVVIGPDVHLQPFERVVRQQPQDDNEDEDSDWEEVKEYQDSVSVDLGSESNAWVWPRNGAKDDGEDDGPDNSKNLRFMRIGDNVSDLDFSDPGSATPSDDSDESISDSEEGDGSSASDSGSASSIASGTLRYTDAESEFRVEVKQSLDRAFAEDHSVENAAVELKTLRMASNVQLRRVREAVIAAIVERIQLIPGDVAAQRREIGKTVNRWGELINKIGGVDGADSVAILQSYCASSDRSLLFGQVLAALYQDDVIEEEDIRKWHSQPSSRGEGLKAGLQQENMKRCWAVGKRMIEQFDEQESDDDSE